MNELQIAARLQVALDLSGRDEWELSRRANVKLSLVEQLLAGSRMAPIGALYRVASALELDIALIAAAPCARRVGRVRTVVDEAIEKLNTGGAIPTAVRTAGADERNVDLAEQMQLFIDSEHAELQRVRDFLRTPEFEALARRLSELGPFDYAGALLVDWLIRPAQGLGARPIDVIQKPGGVSMVTAKLEQIILNARA